MMVYYARSETNLLLPAQVQSRGMSSPTILSAVLFIKAERKKNLKEILTMEQSTISKASIPSFRVWATIS